MGTTQNMVVLVVKQVMERCGRSGHNTEYGGVGGETGHGELSVVD